MRKLLTCFFRLYQRANRWFCTLRKYYYIIKYGNSLFKVSKLLDLDTFFWNWWENSKNCQITNQHSRSHICLQSRWLRAKKYFLLPCFRVWSATKWPPQGLRQDLWSVDETSDQGSRNIFWLVTNGIGGKYGS